METRSECNKRKFSIFRLIKKLWSSPKELLIKRVPGVEDSPDKSRDPPSEERDQVKSLRT